MYSSVSSPLPLAKSRAIFFLRGRVQALGQGGESVGELAAEVVVAGRLLLDLAVEAHGVAVDGLGCRRFVGGA